MKLPGTILQRDQELRADLHMSVPLNNLNLSNCSTQIEELISTQPPPPPIPEKKEKGK